MSQQELFSSDYQPDLVETANTRSLLDQLLSESKLYKDSKSYKELLDFVVKLRNLAPFNAMLLQVQKPGLSYAASKSDWNAKFRRTIIDGARPLLIMWPFGPVALVYDVMDTEGELLPQDVRPYTATGAFDIKSLITFKNILLKNKIACKNIDAGDFSAGSIRVTKFPKGKKDFTHYEIHLNKNHNELVQFATLVHELGHLFLGHLGRNRKLKIPLRCDLTEQYREIEAESVSYIICSRLGIETNSENYLSSMVKDELVCDDLDVYQIMRAAGCIETILKLKERTSFDLVKHR